MAEKEWETRQHTKDKISIEHVIVVLTKYISKCACEMKLSPDVGHNPYKLGYQWGKTHNSLTPASSLVDGNLFNNTIQKPLLVMTASRCLLYGET